MLRGIWAAVLAVLLLGGCGRGGEDFTVQIARPAERVKQELAHIDLDPALTGHLPGLRLERKVEKDDVVYTIPGDGAFNAQIHLTFEPANGGKETIVHAAIDVPAVKVDFDGKAKEISEFKVELAMRKVIADIRDKLEAGEDTTVARKEFSLALTVLAIVTDSKQLAAAMNMEKNPEWYMGGFGSLYDGDDEASADRPAQAYGDPAEGDDPNAPARRQQAAAREHAEDAAAPMDNAGGDEAKGDAAAGEE